MNEITRAHPFCDDDANAHSLFTQGAIDARARRARVERANATTRFTRARNTSSVLTVLDRALSSCVSCVKAYDDLRARTRANERDDDDEAWEAFDRERIARAFASRATTDDDDFGGGVRAVKGNAHACQNAFEVEAFERAMASRSGLWEFAKRPNAGRGEEAFRGVGRAFRALAERERLVMRESEERGRTSEIDMGDDDDFALFEAIRTGSIGEFAGMFALFASDDEKVRKEAKRFMYEVSEDGKARCRRMVRENVTQSTLNVFGFWVECLGDCQRARERATSTRLYARAAPTASDLDEAGGKPFVPQESRLWFVLAFVLEMSDDATAQAVLEQHPIVFELAVNALARATRKARSKPPTPEDDEMIKLASNACDIVKAVLSSTPRGIKHARSFWKFVGMRPAEVINALVSAARMASIERRQDQITALSALKSAYLLLPRGDAVNAARIMDCLVTDVPRSTFFYDAEVRWESRLLACTAVLEQYSEIGVDDAVQTIGDWYDRIGRDLIESTQGDSNESSQAHGTQDEWVRKRDVVARTLVNTCGYIICADAIALSALSDPDFFSINEDRWERDKRINAETALGKLHLKILNTVRTQKRWKVSTAIWEYALGFEKMSEINGTYVWNLAPRYVGAVMYAMGLLAPVARDDSMEMSRRQKLDKFVEIVHHEHEREHENAQVLSGILSRCGKWFFTSLLNCPAQVTEKMPLARSEDEAKCTEGVVLCTMSQSKTLVKCAGEVLKKHYDQKDLSACFKRMFKQGDVGIANAVLGATYSALKDIKRMSCDTDAEVSQLLAAAHAPLVRAQSFIRVIDPKNVEFSFHVSRVVSSSMSLFEAIATYGPHRRRTTTDDENLNNCLVLLPLFCVLVTKDKDSSRSSGKHITSQYRPLKILDSLLSWPPSTLKAKDESLSASWLQAVRKLREEIPDVQVGFEGAEVDIGGDSELVHSIRDRVRSYLEQQGKDGLDPDDRKKLAAEFPDISPSPEVATPARILFRISAPEIDLSNDAEDQSAEEELMETTSADAGDEGDEGGVMEGVDDDRYRAPNRESMDVDDKLETLAAQADEIEDILLASFPSSKKRASETPWLLPSDKKQKVSSKKEKRANIVVAAKKVVEEKKEMQRASNVPLIRKKDFKADSRTVVKPVAPIDLALDSSPLVTNQALPMTSTSLARTSSILAAPPRSSVGPAVKRSSQLREVPPPPVSTARPSFTTIRPPSTADPMPVRVEVPPQPSATSISRLKVPGRGRIDEPMYRAEDFIRDILQQSREKLKQDALTPAAKDIHLAQDAPITFASANEYCEFFAPLIVAELRYEASQKIESGELDGKEFTVMRFVPAQSATDFSTVEFTEDDQRVDGEHTALVKFKVDDLVLIESIVFRSSRVKDALSLRESEEAPYILGWIEAAPKTASSKTPLRVRTFLGGAQATTRHNRIEHAFGTTASRFKVYHVSNVQNALRELRAVIDASHMGFFSALIKPTKFPLRQHNMMWIDSDANAATVRSTLNASQMNAIIGVVTRPYDGNEKVREAPVLIQGPPGTGKTHFIVSLIATLLNGLDGDGRPKQARILCATQSNGAIDEIVERVVNGSPSMDAEFRHLLKGINVVRIGSDDKIVAGSAAARCHVDKKIREIGIEPNDAPQATKYAENAEYYLQKLTELKRKKRDIEEKMRTEEKRLRSNARGTFGVDVKGMTIPAYSAEHENLKKQRDQIFAACDLTERRYKDKLAEEGRNERVPLTTPFEIVVDRANVVCGTLSSMAQLARKDTGKNATASVKSRPDAKQMCGVNLFDVVIVDEASQAVEPAALIPMQWLKPGGVIVLIGDQQQLAPTILSKAAKKAHLDQSLFDRLQRAGAPAYLLYEQYRMHPEIMKFPSAEFYRSQLQCGEGCREENRRAPYHSSPNLGPYQFFDVAGGQMHCDRYNEGSNSWSNSREAEFVALCYLQICRHAERDCHKIRVGIITPYTDQVKRIRDFMKKNEESTPYTSLEVGTMDQVQGQEFDAVIISCVRTRPAQSKSQETIGFLSDARRINVALTRARLSCWIIGDASVLSPHSIVWKKLIENACDRSVYVKVDKNEPLDAVFDGAKLRAQNPTLSAHPLQAMMAPVDVSAVVRRNTEAAPAHRFVTKVQTKNDPRQAARARALAMNVLNAVTEAEDE